VRTVTASGWPYEYRAYLVRYDGWFRHGWKFVIEQKWVVWRRYDASWTVYKTEDLAEAAANARLDALEDNTARRDYVE
jgi:hypothetical protein